MDVTVENFENVLEELRRLLPYAEFVAVRNNAPFLTSNGTPEALRVSSYRPMRARGILPSGRCCVVTCPASVQR